MTDRSHRRLRDLVEAQADDAGLWFIAQTAPEAYLQQELRRLHAAIEEALGCGDPALAEPSREGARLAALAADPALRVKGWDSYGAEPLDDRAIEAARTFLQYGWDVVPTPHGGIQLERHHSTVDLEIEFAADGGLTDLFAEYQEVSALADRREPTKEDVSHEDGNSRAGGKDVGRVNRRRTE